MNEYKHPDMHAGNSCIPWETTIENVKLANAYIPFEKLCTTYTPMRSLIEGTAFPELAGP